MERAIKLRALAIALSIALCRLSVAHADDAALTADDIAAKIVRSDAFAWDGARSKVRMVLVEPNGEKRERAMDVTGRRKQGLFETVVRFSMPQDIAGTAFLMLDRGKEQSEQYIYLPGLKRTRRIVGREREGSFMGSDFTYADMQRVDKQYTTHKRLPDEKLGEDAVYVIDSTISAAAPVSYSRVTTWIRKSDYIALRTRFYDRSGKLAKTLYSRRVREIDGKPVVVEARMQNQLNNHVTELYIDSIERRDDLSDANFTPAALEHL
ncbi:MAG TPA: outer membrane lipoprotein-sorting protein [Polyangiales bacterium]